jgi:hypothetical protein
MNLKRITLNNSYSDIKNKFLNRSINNLKRGDYIKIFFFIYDTKKKGGANSRINKLTALLLKKKVRYNHVSILVSTIYKNEKVKWCLLLIVLKLFV